MMFGKSDRSNLELTKNIACDGAKDVKALKSQVASLQHDVGCVLDVLRGAQSGVDNAMGTTSGSEGAGVVARPEPRDPLEPYHREVLEYMQISRCSMAAAYKAVRVRRLRWAIRHSTTLSATDKAMWLQHLTLIHGEE